MKRWLTMGIACAFLAGCGKDAPKSGVTGKAAGSKSAASAASKAPAEKAAPKGNPLWPGVDLAAEAKRLEGTWKIKTAFGGDADTWEVKGDKVTIKTAKGETKLGTLRFDMPGRIGVKEPNMTSYYSYSRNGDDLYVGLGRAGIKAGDRHIVSTSRGLVIFDGKACHYHEKKMNFGGGPVEFKDAKPVKCSLQAGGDKALLNYQVPRFMKDGEFDDKSIEVVGEALLDAQMKGNKISKAE